MKRKITDEQVNAAIFSAQDEFACWRMISMGHDGTRVIREPKLELPDLEGIVLGDTMTIQVWDFMETGDAGKKLYEFMRRNAGMRAALESVC